MNNARTNAKKFSKAVPRKVRGGTVGTNTAVLPVGVAGVGRASGNKPGDHGGSVPENPGRAGARRYTKTDIREIRKGIAADAKRTAEQEAMLDALGIDWRGITVEILSSEIAVQRIQNLIDARLRYMTINRQIYYSYLTR